MFLCVFLVILVFLFCLPYIVFLSYADLADARRGRCGETDIVELVVVDGVVVVDGDGDDDFSDFGLCTRRLRNAFPATFLMKSIRSQLSCLDADSYLDILHALASTVAPAISWMV